MKGLLTRTISGIIYVAVIIFCILWSEHAFVRLLLFIGAIASLEFAALTSKQKASTNVTATIDTIGTLLMIAGFAFVYLYGKSATAFVALYLLYVIARMVVQLYMPKLNALHALAYSMLSQIYIALPLSLMTLLYNHLGTPHLILGMFIMIWLNDTGAFLVGSTLGRNKLFPRISPKKSWEGFVGGVVFAIASGVLFGACFHEYFNELNTLQLAIAGAVVAIFATWGDLVESLIKRTLGVKDSGNLIPGHGGILDRIDSLLLVVPAMVVYLTIVGYITATII